MDLQAARGCGGGAAAWNGRCRSPVTRRRSTAASSPTTPTARSRSRCCGPAGWCCGCTPSASATARCAWSSRTATPSTRCAGRSPATPGRWGRVAWGAGNAFASSVLWLRADPPGAIRYFGDLDEQGLRIPAGASALAVEEGLPPVRPSTGLYAALLAHGRPGAARVVSADLGPGRRGLARRGTPRRGARVARVPAAARPGSGRPRRAGSYGRPGGTAWGCDGCATGVGGVDRLQVAPGAAWVRATRCRAPRRPWRRTRPRTSRPARTRRAPAAG